METSLPPTTWGNWQLNWGQATHVMGIINVTPDSFSGDGVLLDSLSKEQVLARVLEQARGFVEAGATLLDIGGESTRPHFTPLSAEEEISRVVPVIKLLREQLGPEVILSIDTYKAEVARQALDAGACMVNDTWALRRDPAMAPLVAARSVPVILMANLRESHHYEVVSDVTRFLAGSIDLALAAGVDWERIIVDPGIGFGMGFAGDLTLLRRLGELRVLGRPLLLGTSRKSSIGRVLGNVPPAERLEGTAATVALGIAQGADIVRVHDVQMMMRVAKMSDAIVRTGSLPTASV
jgi:dihydropteroate synthase